MSKCRWKDQASRSHTIPTGDSDAPSWTQLGHLHTLPIPSALLLPVRTKVRARSPSASVWASYPLALGSGFVPIESHLCKFLSLNDTLMVALSSEFPQGWSWIYTPRAVVLRQRLIKRKHPVPQCHSLISADTRPAVKEEIESYQVFLVQKPPME